VDGLGSRSVCCSEASTEVLRSGFSRDAFLCFEPSVDFHSHPVEAAGTLVDDTVAAVAAVVAHAGVVADGILELVDLGSLGLQFHVEMLYLELLGSKLQVPMCKLRLQVGNPQPEDQYWLIH